MERRLVFIAATLLIAGLLGNAAQAHQWGCWIQEDRDVKARNAASSFASQASAAINEWNNKTILNISYVSSGEETYVFSANSGNTGWGGLASVTSYSGCTILRATAQLNTYYLWSYEEARAIYCQEVGHTFGLDHSNDGGCMGAGYWYHLGTFYYVVSHNVNDIGSMYANRAVTRPTTPPHPTVGPEVDTPRFHAFWAHNPRTLRETSRLATEIVVATVTDVANGNPIVNRLKDGYVSRIPTQRVSFIVNRSRKGSLVANESFVLFQNGNENNRFDEDPSYKVGHRYLLFLMPREDGTYLVVSPHGRYEVTSRGLVPATEKGFAASLKGARLQDVLGDVTRIFAESNEQ